MLKSAFFLEHEDALHCRIRDMLPGSLHMGARGHGHLPPPPSLEIL